MNGLETALTISDDKSATFDGAVTVGTDLTVTGSDIVLGNGTAGTFKNEASAEDAHGQGLTISAGSTTNGTSSDKTGGHLTLQGGQGKGNGAGGDIIFQVANAGDESGNSLNNLATALTISDDKSATFEGNLKLLDDKTLILGSNDDIQISYDETTRDSLLISQSVNETALSIVLQADAGQDAGDEWKLNVANGGVVTFGNNIASAGTYVTHLTITPDATASNSVLAVAGNLQLGGNVIKASDGGSTITMDNDDNVTFAGTVSATGAINANDATSSTNKDTGCIIAAGGVGIQENCFIGGNLGVTGHLNYTPIKAEVGTELANDDTSVNLDWSNTGKTFKCLYTGSENPKAVTLAGATAADVGKTITIIQTAIPDGAIGNLTITLTEDTFDTGSYILQGVGGTFRIPVINFAAATNNVLTLSPAQTNCAYSVGTIIKFTVLSATEIRAEITTVSLGDGTTGSIAFSG